MRIYLDVCCFNRPFDDQTQVKIHLESEAILSILAYCRDYNWTLIGSLVVDYEISKTADEEKRKRVMGLTIDTSEKVDVDREVKERALEFEGMGFRTFDALHIACAEKARVDIFLTTDDRLLKRANQEGKNLKVSIANPLYWLMSTGV